MRTEHSDFFQPEHLVGLCIIKSAERFGAHYWDVLYDEGQSALCQTCPCAKVSILGSQPQVKVLSHWELGSVLIKAFLVIKYPQS